MRTIRIVVYLTMLFMLWSCVSPDGPSEEPSDERAGEEPTQQEPPEVPADRKPECPRGDVAVSITGAQGDQWHQRDLDGETTIDARTATWNGIGENPIQVGGAAGSCWQGGHINGRYGSDFTWDDAHETAAFSIYGPDLVVTDLRITNEGDLINLKEEASNFTLSRLRLSNGRDDCIENDYLHAGVLEDSLLDGCYTAFSARPSSDRDEDGSDNEWIIRRSLIRLEPMEHVYKGDPPGHGKFFKWDKEGRGPRLSLHDNIFLAEQAPQSGDLGVPQEYLESCSNNVVVWLGDGDYPGWLPESCFTITRSRSVWDEAVADWEDAFAKG